MSDKIKELAHKRLVAMEEKYKAMFVLQNAAMDWREKSNIFNEIDEQLKQALQEEAEKEQK